MNIEIEKRSIYPIYHESIRIDLQVGFRYNHHQKTDNTPHLHSHDYYELFFLPEHGCEHSANGVTTYLPKGTLLFIRPEDCHDFLNKDYEIITIMQIAVRRGIIDSLFEYLGNDFPSLGLLSSLQPPYVVLNAYETEELLRNLNSLNTIPVDNHREKALAIRTFLATIFPNFFTIHRTSMNQLKMPPDWLSYAYHEMKKQENFSLGIDQMVKLAGCTKEYLCRSVKKYYGHTAMEYINDLRLTFVANMLTYTSDNISDICYQSGFGNTSWAYTLFKKKYGMSPMKFRNEYALLPDENNLHEV